MCSNFPPRTKIRFYITWEERKEDSSNGGRDGIGPHRREIAEIRLQRGGEGEAGWLGWLGWQGGMECGARAVRGGN